jgi:hypothetical protein
MIYILVIVGVIALRLWLAHLAVKEMIRDLDDTSDGWHPTVGEMMRLSKFN